jgi:predicted GNAT family N-acyltransferase
MPPTPDTIRDATLADCWDIAQMLADQPEPVLDGLPLADDPVAAIAAEVAQDIRLGLHHIVSSNGDGSLTGCIVVNVNDAPAPAVALLAEIGRLAVRKDKRGGRAGGKRAQRLITAALERCKAIGAAKVMYAVDEGGTGARTKYYQRFGFEPAAMIYSGLPDKVTTEPQR